MRLSWAGAQVQQRLIAAFYDHVLWSHLDGLIPLFKCLPPECYRWSEQAALGCHYPLSGGLWSRVKSFLLIYQQSLSDGRGLQLFSYPARRFPAWTGLAQPPPSQHSI